MKFFDPEAENWNKPSVLPNWSWRCGYCGDKVSSTRGLKLGRNGDGSGVQVGAVYICTNCGGPSFFPPYKDEVFPGTAFGSEVGHLPEELDTLYEEARRCTSQNCHTAAVLLCRKILMNIAVKIGAEEGKSFVSYIDYLSNEGYIPPNGRHWVDHIRKRGNEANHEVQSMEPSDAEELVRFTEMLLKIIFEFPALVPRSDQT